jgi:hypothetical protein
VEQTGTPIEVEALFRPSTRLRDSPSNRYLPEGWTELELLPGLTIENVWATGVTWDEFHRFLCHKVVWMAPNVYVCSRYLYGEGDPWVLRLGSDHGPYMFVRVRSGTDAAAATATCDVFVRLLATSEEHDVYIRGCSDGVSTPLSGAGLSLFFQESHSCLRRVSLENMALNADQCLALATMSRLDVELRIHICTPADDAAGAFVEFLHGDKCPVALTCCTIDNQILASALTGNSRVTRFKPYNERTNDAGMAILVAALSNNRGLEDLDLREHAISDDNWSVLCESLKTHPTLTKLYLHCTSPRSPPSTRGRIVMTDDQKAHRTRLLAEMMQENTILNTLELSESVSDQQIYTEEILPYLETNRYRPRVLAIKKADLSLRRSLLGLALQTESVRKDSNLLWIFLSENADILVIQSSEDDEQVEEVAAIAPVLAVAAAGTRSTTSTSTSSSCSCKRKL